MPSFWRNMDLKKREKSRPFSRIFGSGPFAGSLSKNLTPGDVSFSLTPASVDLAMLPACDPSVSIKCAVSKSNKALQRAPVAPAWQGHPSQKQTSKNKNSHSEVLHRAWSKDLNCRENSHLYRKTWKFLRNAPEKFKTMMFSCLQFFIFSAAFVKAFARDFNTQLQRLCSRREVQRFRKGVGGRGLATNKPQKEPKKFSRNVSPFS